MVHGTLAGDVRCSRRGDRATTVTAALHHSSYGDRRMQPLLLSSSRCPRTRRSSGPADGNYSWWKLKFPSWSQQCWWQREGRWTKRFSSEYPLCSRARDPQWNYRALSPSGRWHTVPHMASRCVTVLLILFVNSKLLYTMRTLKLCK